MYKFWRRITIGLSLCVLCTIIASCASRDDSSSEAKSEAALPAAAGMKQADSLKTQTTSDKASGISYSASSEESATNQQSTSTLPGGGVPLGRLADANAGFNLKMIYSADVSLKVAKLASGEDLINQTIARSRAYIVEYADSETGSDAVVTYVIKVPSEAFGNLLTELGRIPNNGYERAMKGEDVSEEYVDLDARLKAKQAVEARLIAFMDKATKSDDLVRFCSELGNVQQEIEQIQGRKRYLDQNVAYSTVHLRLSEGEPELGAKIKSDRKTGLGQRLGDTLADSVKLLKKVGEGLLVGLAACLPVLLVLAVIGLPLGIVLRNRRKRRRAEAALKRAERNRKAEAEVEPDSESHASNKEEES